MLQQKLGIVVLLACVCCRSWSTEAATFYRSAAEVYQLYPTTTTAAAAAEPQQLQPHVPAAAQATATADDMQHSGFAIVAPLTKLAHITYDSVPITHTPYEHVPLFQRISHVEAPARH